MIVTVGRPKKAKTSEDYRRLVAFWAKRIGVTPKRVQVQQMKNKWASCSSTGRLCFSLELLGASASVQNAVAVHELIHLIVPNHGKLFKAMIKAFLPANNLGRIKPLEK